MAATTKKTVKTPKHQGRRVMPKSRRQAAKAKARAAVVTVGDLIAAAFDAVGSEVRDVATVLSSRELTRVTGRRLVFV